MKLYRLTLTALSILSIPTIASDASYDFAIQYPAEKFYLFDGEFYIEDYLQYSVARTFIDPTLSAGLVFSNELFALPSSPISFGTEFLLRALASGDMLGAQAGLGANIKVLDTAKLEYFTLYGNINSEPAFTTGYKLSLLNQDGSEISAGVEITLITDSFDDVEVDDASGVISFSGGYRVPITIEENI